MGATCVVAPGRTSCRLARPPPPRAPPLRLRDPVAAAARASTFPYPWTAGGHRQANQPDPFAVDQSRLNQSEAMAHAAPNIGPIKKTVIKP
jgi:hypothetical protein